MIAAIGVAIAGLNFVATHVWPKIRVRRARRSVTKSLVAPSLRDYEIESYCQYYVEPFVQDVDLMGAEEPRAVAGVKNTLLKHLMKCWIRHLVSDTSISKERSLH